MNKFENKIEKSEPDAIQAVLDFDKKEKNLEEFGGFISFEERKKIAREYRRITLDEIKKFYKIGDEIFHEGLDGKLEPVDSWFAKDEELWAKDSNSYRKGDY